MSSDTFNGFNQSDSTRIVDSNGDELAINADGSINVGVTAAIEYEIKNDTGAPLPISDGGGSVTVDDGGVALDVSVTNFPASVEISNDAGNPLPVSGTVTITDGSGPVTVDGTVNIGTMPEVEIKNDAGNPVPVSGTVTITDGSGPVTVDGTVAAAEAKLEDAPAASGDSGFQMLGVRNDTDAVRTSNDGDYSALAVDDAGRVKVVGPVTDAQLRATPVPVSGTVTITDGAGPVTVDGTVAVGPTVVPGTGATNLGKEEDAPHASGDVGVMALGVRNDADAVLTSADGDYTPLAVDSAGRVKTVVSGGMGDAGDPLASYRNINVNATGSVVSAVPAKLFTIVATKQLESAAKYLKIYNTNVAPTAADTPVMTIPLVGDNNHHMGYVMAFEHGLEFSAGIGIRATTGIADADNVSPGVNFVVVNLGFR